MPSESPWPIVLAFCAVLALTMILLSHYAIAGIFVLLALLALAGWHTDEPEPVG
jgi:hypothetical protein